MPKILNRCEAQDGWTMFKLVQYPIFQFSKQKIYSIYKRSVTPALFSKGKTNNKMQSYQINQKKLFGA